MCSFLIKDFIYTLVNTFSWFSQILEYAVNFLIDLNIVTRNVVRCLSVYTLYQSLIFVLIPSGIPSTEETMSSLLTVIQSSSQSQLGSQQYSECPVSEWNSGGNSTTSATSSNGQVGSVCFLCCYVSPSIGNLSESTQPGCRISRVDKFLNFMDTCFCT